MYILLDSVVIISAKLLSM